MLSLSACHTVRPRPVLVQGVVWQPHNGAADPRGNWHKLGVNQLLVQWSVVDGTAYVPGTGLPPAAQMPNWQRIGHEPWAQSVVLGLAGRFDSESARQQIATLVQQSERIARLPQTSMGPAHVDAWYFPVEVDPTWAQATRLREWLAPLPRPLWISLFDNHHLGAAAFAEFVDKCVPSDVGVFLQDGVGLHVRDAVVARHYLDALRARLGTNRVKVIAEVFRPQAGGSLRSASVQEILAQLSHYDSYPIFLFDGPAYLPDPLVEALALELAKAGKP